jgi:Na+/alanine symporter
MIRRRIPSSQGNAVSLFPFLAVLVCTMGSLIILLVLVVQQARVGAESLSEDTEAKLEEKREQAR